MPTTPMRSSDAVHSVRPRRADLPPPPPGVVIYAETTKAQPASAGRSPAAAAGFRAGMRTTQPSEALKRVQAASPGRTATPCARAAPSVRELLAQRKNYTRLVMEDRLKAPINTRSYSLVEKFTGQGGESVGGATGSTRVRLGAQYYQLKRHICHAALKQKFAAQWSNVQNYGEVIGASVARALVGRGYPNGTVESQLAPEVTLMHDAKLHETAVVSLYLRDGLGDIDTYYKKHYGPLPYGRKHARLDLREHDDRLTADRKDARLDRRVGIDGPPVGTLRLQGEAARDVRRHVAAAALLGDHDINTGNLIVVGPPGAPADGTRGQDGGQLRVGRIDYGHAFNHLIHGVGGRLVGGGGVQDVSGNRILDFFNRERVRGNPTNSSSGVSKLWRDYTGLLPSHHFAATLAQMADTDVAVFARGIEEAKSQFAGLLTDLRIEDPTADNKEIKDIVKCLKTIASNIGRPVACDDPLEVLQQVMQGIQAFVEEGCAQMRYVARLCAVQASIDDVLRANSGVGLEDPEFPLAGIQSLFLALAESPGQTDPATARITWLKTADAQPALTGTLGDYLAQRRRELP